MSARRMDVTQEVETAMEFVRLIEGTGDEWFRSQRPASQWAILDDMEEALAVIDLAIIDLRGSAKGHR